MNPREHWEHVYATKANDEVSWYAPHLDVSLDLIERTALSREAEIIDIGGGQSTLVDDLLARGYEHLSVLDISQAAMDGSRKRLGAMAAKVHWIADDITSVSLHPAHYDLWHDRAVFHFLTAPEDRAAYIRQLTQSLKPGAHVILATFGPQGPMRCSGLDTVRYDAVTLHHELGNRFSLIESSIHLHRTPSGAEQQFLYCRFQFA